QACDLKFHGGVDVDAIERSDGYRALGAETIQPILARGVLLDVARWKGVDVLPPHYAITAEDLAGCAAATRVRIDPGNVPLVRTGYARAWTDEATYLGAAGASKSGNVWAADRRVRAVGADNMAWDSMEERDPD